MAVRAPKVPEIRKGDTVVVLGGKDAGKTGKVERVIRREPAPAGRSMYRRGSSAGGVSVVVEGLNIAKRHTKPRQSASATDRMPKIQQGGIMDIAQPVPIGKVMLVCSSCGQPTRIGHKTLETGRRVRVCRRVRPAAGGEGMSGQLHAALHDRGRARPPEAVRVRQSERGPAPREDRREHRPRRGADQRQGHRRRGRRHGAHHRPEAGRDQGQAVDRPVPRPRGQLGRGARSRSAASGCGTSWTA